MQRLAILFLLIIVLVQTAVPSTRIFASDEGLILTLETNETEVKSGEEFSYMINYSASSAASHYTDPKITFLLPEWVTITGKTDSAITTSKVTDSIDFPGRKEVTFQFKDGILPAGSTGQLVVRGKFENYTTPDGTSTTATAQFNAVKEGSPVSMDSNSVTVTATASASWNIQIRKVAPVVEPFKGSNVEYEINVQPESSSTGQLDIKDIILSYKLADGAVFVSVDNGGTMGPDNTLIWNLEDGLRGLKSVKVVVNYPDSMTATEVTSQVTLTYTPIGQVPMSVSASTTHGFELQPKDRGTAPTVSNKNGVKEISPGQTVTFTLSDLSNNANIDLQSGVLELMTPTLSESGTPIQFQLQSIKSAIFSGISDYHLYYTLEENPSAGDWTLWTNLDARTATTLDATALGNIKGIQVRFSGLPISWKQLRDFEFTYRLDSNTSLPVDSSETIELLAQYDYVFSGTPKSSTGYSEIDIVDHRPLLELSNTASKSSVVPNETMTYTFSVTNHPAFSSSGLNNPVIYNILPSELEYIPGTWAVVKSAGTPNDPSFKAVPQPSGETKLTWSWDDSNPGVLQIGENIQIKFDAKIKPGTPAQTIRNTFSVESPRYLNDVKYSNVKTVGIEIYKVKVESEITVSESTALQSEMWVKGELDSDWSKYPDTGSTTPGGNALYRLKIQNVGNVAMKDLVIVNPFPRIGDKAVLNGSVSRGSQWGPVLTGSVVAPSYVTVYYSTTSGISMNPTTGTDNGVWMTSLPDDPTSVQAIKMEFDDDYVIDPLNTTTLEWNMRAPVGAPTGGEVAWNSFAYKMNKVSGQSILPVEPLKVGISILSSPKAWIGDFVWLDSNENGLQDPGESGINGVTVELYDELGTKLAQTVTSNDFFGNPGYYLFPNLEAGNYYIQFISTSEYGGWTGAGLGSDSEKNSKPNSVTGRTEMIALAPGEKHSSIDAGILKKKGKIGSYVWLDSNENGLQDIGESGINGITVELYDGTSTLLATTTTATSNGLPGQYEFNNLSPGNYQVGFVLPDGYKFTQKGADSSVEPSTGRTAVVALAPGEENVGIDAGLIHLALPLNIQFEANGNAYPAKTAVSKVTLTDTESGVDAASLEYVWTQSTTVPTGGWTAFASGDTLTHTGEDGSWYLHIRAIDRIGNPAYAVSNAFVLKAPATTDTANNSVSASPSTVTVGDTVTLTAMGDRQLEAGVVIGDERYIPTSWSSTESGKSGTFILDSGNYSTTYMPSTAGSYTVTVTFKKQIWGGDDWEDAGEDTKTVAVTVYSVPTYSIAPILDRTLSALKQGYVSGQQETATIDVINTGTGELENVTATLSGANANDFVLTPPSDTIGSGSASSLTITAKDGLGAGTYMATVTVSADHMTSVTFTVTQVVKPVSSPPPSTYPVTGISLNETELTLTVGDEPYPLEVTITPAYATNKAVTWTSSDPDVAQVDRNGQITAKKAGQATITVTSVDGQKTATSQVTVVEEDVLQLEVSPSSMKLETGERKAFKVYAVKGNERKEITKDKSIHYDMDNDFISVKSGNVIAGKKAGKSEITISYEGAETKLEVTIVKAGSDSSTLEGSEKVLLVQPNRTASFQVYSFETGTRNTITKRKETTYTIEDDSLVTIRAGRVTAGKEEGETTLTIRYRDEELTIPVVISTVSVKSLEASATSFVLGLDEEEQSVTIRAAMSNKRDQDVTDLVYWSSGTPGVVKILADGTLRPLKKGTAVLSAKYGGKSVSVKVLVLEEKEPQKLQADRSSLTLEKEESKPIEISALYEKNYKEVVTDKVEWDVEDPEIASVEDGVIQAISAGKTTIKATYAGKEVTIRLTVR